MSLCVKYNKCKSSSEAFTLLESVTKDLPVLKENNVVVEAESKSSSFKVTGSGFSATLKCEKDQVVIDYSLSFLLKPFKATIEKRIVDEFSQVI